MAKRSSIIFVVAAAALVGAQAASCKARYVEVGPPKNAVLQHADLQQHAALQPSTPIAEPHIPPRARDAMGGAAFLDSIKDFAPDQRERAIFMELAKGNMPDFLRELVPVRITSSDGQGPSAIVHVMPDYLAVGSNHDFVRVPMNLFTATALGREWGFVLPTSRIVDAIYDQAGLRVSPSPLPACNEMTTVPYFQKHEKIVAEQLARAVPGQLVAGHKKDIVLSNKFNRAPGRIIIYGWHKSSGDAIQPVSNKHEASYADYSHGVRLVSATVWINGERRSIYDALNSFDTASLLSNEGAIENARSMMDPIAVAPALDPVVANVEPTAPPSVSAPVSLVNSF